MPGLLMGRTNNQFLVAKTNGKIGELLTAVELLRHGFTVSWPSVDIGYDLISDDDKGKLSRLQVKTALPGKQGTYSVIFGHGRVVKRLYTKEDTDAFVAVLNYTDGLAFYVIPIEGILSMKGIFWQPGQHPRYPDKWRTCKYEEYRDRWDLLR